MVQAKVIYPHNESNGAPLLEISFLYGFIRNDERPDVRLVMSLNEAKAFQKELQNSIRKAEHFIDKDSGNDSIIDGMAC